MATNTPNPGDIEFQFFNITSIKGEVFDLKYVILELNIFEDVKSDSLRATVTIEDGLSIITTLPIVGGETVSLRFRTPSTDGKSEWASYNLVVTAIESLQETNPRTEVFNLILDSPDAIKNEQKALSKAVGPKAVNEIIDEILKKDLETTSNTDMEKCKGEQQLVLPNITPYKSIRLLQKYAESEKYPKISDFLFWQDQKGYKFKTIQALIEEQPKEQYFVKEHDLSQDVKSSTKSKYSGKHIDFLKMYDYSFPKVVNHMHNLKYGMYDSKLMVIDPVKHRFEILPKEKKHFHYKDTFSEYKNTAEGSGHKLLQDQSEILKGEGDSHLIYMHSGTMTPGDDHPEQIENYLQMQTSSYVRMGGPVLEISVPGDSSRLPGDKVEIVMPEFGATDDIKSKLHKFLKGFYLVTSVRHIYSPTSTTGYTTVLELAKTCYEESVG